ncbi:MAG: NAD(P)-dependent oxidoreductase [Alphaproteobacteria bacterium]|nr:NAD(P)-dependent oxidoreductase [Alphaproteobacteria bacterium]
MGYPMAGHLVRAGHDVTVYNRTAARAARWAGEHGGHVATSPAEAAAGARIVFCCVGNDDDVRQVAVGPHGAMPAMAEGTVFVDHTTTSATLARELHAWGEPRGVAFVDAPISGGQSGAEKGVLTVMGGGDEPAWSIAEPVIRAYARQARRIGPSGAGQTTKMMNQVAFGAAAQGIAEAIWLGRAAGLDLPAVFDVITQGAAGSWQMENRWRTMVDGEFDFGFAVDWMRKDLGIVLAEAERLGLDLPVAKLLDGFYAEVQQMGGHRWDTSSLVARGPGASRRED